MSDTVTEGVRVRVDSRYHPERSQPARGYYFFSYTVRIENDGSRPVQLRSRHWVITDANGHIEHVRGPGVIGEQPHLSPGEHFEYTSACPLPTSLGSMEGTYEMVRDDGSTFDAVIGAFALADPESLN
jgi:ApaG protein